MTSHRRLQELKDRRARVISVISILEQLLETDTRIQRIPVRERKGPTRSAQKLSNDKILPFRKSKGPESH